MSEMKNFSVSIGMATYNGEKFLKEQLDSFCSQSRLPDELVVCDDGSNDETIDIIESYKNTFPFKLKLFRNKANLGYTRNFEKVLEQCTGDLIFLSDQDDIWHENKVLKMCNLAENNPHQLLFLNDAEIIFGNGNKTGLTIRSQLHALGLSDRQFSTGCCMAIRKELKPLILPIPYEHFSHDSWINLISMTIMTKLVDGVVLQGYRRHNDNVSAPLAAQTVKQNQLSLARSYGKESSSAAAQLRINKLKILSERIIENESIVDSLCSKNLTYEIILNRINKESKVVKQRMRILALPIYLRPVLVLIFFVTGKYRYFKGWKSFAKDLITK